MILQSIPGIGLLTAPTVAGSVRAEPGAKPAPPVGDREPTEAEMLTALRFAVHGDADALNVDNAVSGYSVAIDGFEKIGCVRAVEKPGHVCDYIVSASFDFRSNEGTLAGDRHARAVQGLYEAFVGMSNAPKSEAGSGRFVYAPSKKRWVYLKK